MGSSVGVAKGDARILDCSSYRCYIGKWRSNGQEIEVETAI